jgi:hypothetical protein
MEDLDELVQWPKTELEMLEIQAKDIYWEPIVKKLLEQRREEIENNFMSEEDNTPTIPIENHIKYYQLTDGRSVYIKFNDEGEIGALRIRNKDKPQHERVVLPTALIKPAILMYHDLTGQPQCN